MSLVKTIMRTIPIPGPVAAYFVSRFEEYLKILLENPHVPDVAFAGANPAAAPANTAEILLSRDLPTVIAAWCESRDKREGTVSAVIHQWSLPVGEQHKLASKALSDDAARAVLRLDSFADTAKALAARRASAGAVITWLATDPSDLPDEEFLAVLDRIERHRPILDSVELYSALYNRRHLLGSILASERHQMAMAACAFADHVDHAEALERIAAAPAEVQVHGLVNLLDHPALDRDVRNRGFELAATLGVLDAVYAAGCPLPGSLLTAATPLSAIEDPLVVEALTSRSFTGAVARAFQFADLAVAPGAGLPLAHRLAAVRRKHPCPGTSRQFAALASTTGYQNNEAGSMSFWPGNKAVLRGDEERRAAQRKAAALTEPFRENTRYSHRVSYWGSNGEVYSTEQMVTMTVDSFIGAVGSYRSHDSNPLSFATYLTSMLGDGSDEKSLQRWERFVQLAQRATPMLVVGKIVSSAVKLT